jgi:hypothetical protein
MDAIVFADYQKNTSQPDDLIAIFCDVPAVHLHSVKTP